MKTKFEATYYEATDSTFILKHTYTDDENCVVSTEVVGLYPGLPNDKDIEPFTGKLNATYGPTDYCLHCGKDLSAVTEIHSVEGGLYCSKECAIDNQTEVIMQSAHDIATEWYNDWADIIIPADIGIV